MIVKAQASACAYALSKWQKKISIIIKMEERYINEDYMNIANKLIKKRTELSDLKDADISFCILSSNIEKKQNGKVILGQCEMIPDKYKWSIPYDFTIVIYDPNCVALNKKQMEILILHELMHIGIALDGDEPRYYVVPHDYEEFKSIIDDFGLDWMVV